MLSGLREKLCYKIKKPLYYTEGLKRSYMSHSVAGGTLSGKNVWITGGTGGIGKAVAIRFVLEGCNVIISGRNEKKLSDTVKNIKKEFYGNISYIVLDHSEPKTFGEIIENIFQKFNGIDYMVNCTGILTDTDRERKFRSVTKEQYETSIDINLNSMWSLSKKVADYMCSSEQSGIIINISSICAFNNQFSYTPYGMSKAGLISMTRYMNDVYKDKNIMFRVIAPGSVATQMNYIVENADIASRCNNILRRQILPEEIAALIAFLCSDTGCDIRQDFFMVSANEQL